MIDNIEDNFDEPDCKVREVLWAGPGIAVPAAGSAHFSLWFRRRPADRTLAWSLGIALTIHAAAIATAIAHWSSPPRFQLAGERGNGSADGPVVLASAEIAALESRASLPDFNPARAAIAPDLAGESALHIPIETALTSTSSNQAASVDAGDVAPFGMGVEHASVPTPAPLRTVQHLSAAVESGGGTQPTPSSGNPRPRYPREALRRHLEGTVTLRVAINCRGVVERLIVERSCGHAMLDDSAVEAVSKWRFAPATVMGGAVASEVLLPVQFVVDR